MSKWLKVEIMLKSLVERAVQFCTGGTFRRILEPHRFGLLAVSSYGAWSWVNGFLHVANCFNVQPCYQTRTKFILYVFLLYLIVICRTGVKKNCGKVKKQQCFTLFLWWIQLCYFCLGNLQFRSDATRRECARERGTTPRENPRIWPLGWLICFFRKRSIAEKIKENPSEFKNFADIFAPQVTEDRMCSIATFFSCLDFCLVWTVVAALNSWVQGREGWRPRAWEDCLQFSYSQCH